MKKFILIAVAAVVVCGCIVCAIVLRDRQPQAEVPSTGSTASTASTGTTTAQPSTSPSQSTAPTVSTEPSSTPAPTPPAPTAPSVNPPNVTMPTDPVPPGPTGPVATNPLPEGVILEELLEYYEKNPHTVGWICIAGTRVNYPVLQTPNKYGWTNYYLNRDFNGNYSSRGCIYVRERCQVFGVPSDNVVIYGHAMADNSMFGTVTYYGERSYYEQHKYIEFNTLFERHTYEVIAVFSTSGTTGVGYPYHTKNNFSTEEAFNAFINAIRGGISNVYAFYDIDTPVEYGDKLITLSTCYDAVHNDGRLVVVAKRIT